MPAVLRYFYNVSSPWSYLGLEPLIDLASRHGAVIEPHLIPLIEENGGIYSRNRPEARRAYFWTDLRRWAALRGKTLVTEGRADLANPAPAARLVVASLLDGGDWLALTRVLQSAFWERGVDVGDASTRTALLAGSGLSDLPSEERAVAQDVTDYLAASIDLARREGVWGLPTHLVAGETYWGQDSLPFLDRHLTGAATLTPTLPGPLVSTEWLARHLDAPGLTLLDSTFTLPGVQPDARALHVRAHIPGARFFDVDQVADPAATLPHMLPDAATFSRHAAGLGLARDKPVVIYDGPGLQSAARAWWTLRAFGFRDLAILDGGLRKWLAEGRPVSPGVAPPLSSSDAPTLDGPDLRLVADKARLKELLGRGAAQIVDARPAARFEGTAPEPRPGLRSGHVPGSLNLPVDQLSDPTTGTVLPLERLRARLSEVGIDAARPVVATCGSGVSAAAVAFALHLIGAPDAAVYDGSWSEWGQPGDTPVETGPARVGVPA